ncbi:MAG: metallopeptidase family protein [Propionibacteriaceae bacterium]
MNRNRHLRGLRGPLARTSPLLGEALPLRRRESSRDFFVGSIAESIRQISKDCPQALTDVTVGVEDVPTLSGAWAQERVPLAAATSATPTAPATVTVYRRPLEFRATSRRALDVLVYRTIVEQLAALTGLEVSTIDPTGRSRDTNE